MNIEAMKQVYLAGFMASGEGYNGEYPFRDKGRDPEDDPEWCRCRDDDIRAVVECAKAWPASANPFYAALHKHFSTPPEAPAAPEAPETMTLQEVWNAAGCNPNIKPTKQDVLDQLKLMDEVCDAADTPAATVQEPGNKRICRVCNGTGKVLGWDCAACKTGHQSEQIELQPPAAQRKPLTPEQREKVCIKAEQAMHADPNLSWRNALITQTEAAHGITGEKK